MSTFLNDIKNSCVGGMSLHRILSSATTTDGVAVDMINGDGVHQVIASIGEAVTGAASVTFSVVECDTVGGSYTAVPVTYDAPAAADAASEQVRFSFLRSKRFVKVRAVSAGTVTSWPVFACILANAKQMPPTT